jgi:hypothetical protein
VEARRVKTPTNRSDVRQSQNRSKDGPPLNFNNRILIDSY